jgi:hypothetical protein
MMYLDILELWLQLQLTEDFSGHLLFQQVGVPHHYHSNVREFLDKQLHGSWTGHSGLTLWPP